MKQPMLASLQRSANPSYKYKEDSCNKCRRTCRGKSSVEAMTKRQRSMAIRRYGFMAVVSRLKVKVVPEESPPKAPPNLKAADLAKRSYHGMLSRRSTAAMIQRLAVDTECNAEALFVTGAKNRMKL